MRYPMLWEAVRTTWTREPGEYQTLPQQLVQHVNHLLMNRFRTELGIPDGPPNGPPGDEPWHARLSAVNARHPPRPRHAPATAVGPAPEPTPANRPVAGTGPPRPGRIRAP